MEEITLSTGVILNLWKGSTLALDQATEALKKSDPVPEPPMVFSEDKGREESNPNDPAYIKAIANWNGRLSIRFFTVLLATASSVKFVPENMIKHDSDEFVEVLEMSGIEPRRTNVGLYVQWVALFAGLDDQELLGTHLLQLAGVSEASIAEAEATFRSDEERDTDQDAPDNRDGHDRDRVSVETAGPGI